MSKAVSGYPYYTSQAWKQVIEAFPTTYTVWLDGTTCRAEANKVGATDFGDANPKTVVQAVLDATADGDSVIIKDSLDISGQLTISKAIHFGGIDPSVKLIETDPTKDLLNVAHDNVTVHDITLNTQDNNARAAFVSTDHSYVTVRDSILLGSPTIFTVYWAGPTGATQAAPLYDYYNSMDNCYIEDRYNGDGLSWSFQKYGRLTRIQEHGSRLAVFCCSDCLVDDFKYTKGDSAGSWQGIWVTNPSNNITFDHLDILDALGTVILADDEPYTSTNIKCFNSNFKFTGAGPSSAGVWFKRATGLTFANNYLQENVALIIGGTGTRQDFIVSNNRLPQVAFIGTVASTLSNIKIHDNLFHAFTPFPGQNGYHICNYNVCTLEGRVHHNTFENAAGAVENPSNLMFDTNDNYEIGGPGGVGSEWHSEVRAYRTNAGDWCLSAYKEGDANPRVTINTNGEIWFSNGTAFDQYLKTTRVGALGTAGSLECTDSLSGLILKNGAVVKKIYLNATGDGILFVDP